MKTPLKLSLGLAAGVLGIAAAPAAAARNLQMIIVAERPDAATPAAQPGPEHPVYYVAFDGGYVEAGDPIANEQPPATTIVSQSLQAALASRGYEAATDVKSASTVLIYHWGLLNRNSHPMRNGSRVDPNLHARLCLVSTDRQDRDIEEYLVNRQMLGASQPDMLNFREQDILQLARDNRYFVVVSAYDYAAANRREPGLLWRAKFSAYSGGIAMAEALPALIKGGAPFLGRHMNGFKNISTPLVPGVQGASGSQQFAPPLGNPGSLDAKFLRGLMKQEHDEFSGARSSDNTVYEPIVSAQPAGVGATPLIGPMRPD
jgi:hypothetical protein